jgi:hypothetical protein
MTESIFNDLPLIFNLFKPSATAALHIPVICLRCNITMARTLKQYIWSANIPSTHQKNRYEKSF